MWESEDKTGLVCSIDSFWICLSFSLKCKEPSSWISQHLSLHLLLIIWKRQTLKTFSLIQVDRRQTFYKICSQIFAPQTNYLRCNNCCHRPCSHSCSEVHICHYWAHSYHHTHNPLCTPLSSHKGKMQKCHCMLMGRQRHTPCNGCGLDRAVLCGWREHNQCH